MPQDVLSRRRFCVSALASVPVLLVLPRGVAALERLAVEDDVRELSFMHLHTRERLDVEYWSGGDYVPSGLRAINRVLRDWRTDEERAIDPELLNLLNELVRATGTESPFEVISGYRSPATNEMLRKASGGVAGSSLHMAGKAIDIRLADVPLARLRDTAIGLRRGGVGYYASSNFVHVDTGRVRTW